jgi:hypothetical protein
MICPICSNKKVKTWSTFVDDIKKNTSVMIYCSKCKKAYEIVSGKGLQNEYKEVQNEVYNV